jgi:type I restriction enzyme S subunit
MSRYKAYPAYRDSGVEWLGKVPSEWKLCPLKFMARIKNGQDYKRVEADEGYPVIGSGGQFSYASQFTYNKASVLLGRKGTIDKPLYINEPFWTVDTMYYTEVNEDVDPKFLYYLALTIQFSRYATNTALPSMTQENLGNYIFAIPTNSESRKNIAAFLDHETAKIDALIEKQQRLIELLKEKRQAVISHAVTKGLNPNAPMKDSGVEWLGEVPAHWDVHAIKHIVSTPITDGPHETPEFFDTGIPFVSAEAVSSGRIDFEIIRAHISDADNQRYSKKYSPKKFDIYMVKSGATTGVTAIVETDNVFNIWSPLAAIRCNELNYPYFVLNFMRSRNFADAIAISWSFGTQQNIGMKVIENLPITRPPLSEAIEIANSLQDKSAKFDKIILHAQGQIELMQERRTALISAAVTGKIDVRDWQAAA